MEAGKWSIVEFLLDNGANINNETTYQETPLHCAVQEGNLDIVKFLLIEALILSLKMHMMKNLCILLLKQAD